ncbi:MAG: hypothetical protein CMH57_15270 [Myxococcales bacterium]|nr:hypothetical protein [Myxococcales bacterium]
MGCSDSGGSDEPMDTGVAGEDSSQADTGAGSDVAEEDTGEGVDTSDSIDSATVDTAVEQDVAPDVEEDPCPELTCGDAQRRTGCRCVPTYDRSCTRQSECRPEETCQEVDGVQLCWYEPPPVKACPGAEGCEAGAGELLAGASSRVITPDGFETATAQGLGGGVTIDFGPQQLEGNWNDCGLDGVCPEDPEYTGADEGEEDGIPQGMWIAGFSSGRPAQYCPEELVGCPMLECCVSRLAHDDLKAQVVVMRQGDVTVAMVTLDVIGIFRPDIVTIRERLKERVDVDLLLVAALHSHEGPDTIGQWGPGSPAPFLTGRTPHFIEKMLSETAAGVEEAIANLEPVSVSAKVLDVGTEGLAINDSRTPYIFDDNVPVVRLSRGDGSTVATLLSFGNHAEVLWSGNPYLTADYPGYARHYIEEGLPETEDVNTNETKPALEGLGGVTVLFAGAVGGLIYPGPGGAIDYAGNRYDEHAWATADAVGQALASHVLGAVHGDEGLDAIESPTLRFSTREYMVGVENTIFQFAFLGGLFDRKVYNAVDSPLTPRPGLHSVITEVAVVGLGPITFFTAPGEMFPEALVGGYPGRDRVQTPVVGDRTGRLPATCDEDGLPVEDGSGSSPCIIRADAENPPDWSQAPEEPPGYALVPGEYPFFMGLTMDFLGYMVPTFDFQTEYLNEAPGDHYEETNSIGPESLVNWRASFEECLEAFPPP